MIPKTKLASQLVARGLLGLSSVLLTTGLVLIIGEATGCQTIKALTQPTCGEFAATLVAERKAAGWSVGAGGPLSGQSMFVTWAKPADPGRLSIDTWVFRADAADASPTDDAFVAAGFALETECVVPADGARPASSGSFWHHAPMTIPAP